MQHDNYSTIYILRHAQSLGNVNHIVQGQMDFDISREGRRQARELAANLGKIKFDKIFSSDLKRAQKTAKIIAAEHKVAVETTRLLRERAYGRLEGKPSKEVFSLLDSLYAQIDKEKIGDFKPFDDVESFNEVIERFIRFVREVAVAYKNKTVLIVTHGGVIWLFLLHLGIIKYEQREIKIKNTAYLKLLCDGVDFLVKEIEGIEV
jgi:broad specificity phosphatase PhoE